MLEDHFWLEEHMVQWIPACAGMTGEEAVLTRENAVTLSLKSLYLKPLFELEHLVHRDLPKSQVFVELAAPRVGGGDLE
jgi:hypothetical protein